MGIFVGTLGVNITVDIKQVNKTSDITFTTTSTNMKII